jgi:hypothetical protein
MAGNHPSYTVSAGVRVPNELPTANLANGTAYFKEYDYINQDAEIGFLDSVSSADVVLLVQLHEIAHAADKWMEKMNIALPTAMVEIEKGLRTDEEKDNRSGHGVRWSAIYRMLRRRAGLVARTGAGGRNSL